ncbi:hypothetical protein BU15DRAFT_66993 [Melanogaster broomeanus]|nr:hypothetical protein BU15DRAFT_66993 [Melanogaster broomeanus]
MHLETAHEWFQNLANLFEMKKSEVTQGEATRDPRTLANTHQTWKQSERTCKPESATAAELCNLTCHEWKYKAGEQGKVERRDRRGLLIEGCVPRQMHGYHIPPRVMGMGIMWAGYIAWVCMGIIPWILLHVRLLPNAVDQAGEPAIQIWGTMEIAKGVACKTDKENNRELLFYKRGLDRRRKV